MALVTYTPSAADALGTSRTFPAAIEESFSAHNSVYATAKFIYKPIADEILRLNQISHALVGRNRVINGPMKINQRRGAGSGLVNATNGGFLVDRFFTGIGGAYGVTAQWAHSTTVPASSDFTAAGIPYRPETYSLQINSPQDTSLGTDGLLYIGHKIEGYNSADLVGDGYNTGFTISFWARSTKAGTYCVTLRDSGSSRTYAFEYTLVANTWKYVTHTVTAAPSGGTWSATNGIGLNITWALCIGTDFDDATAGAWVSSNELCTVNQVNFAADVGTASFYLHQVQLEPGTVATRCEAPSYTNNLQQCLRYCWQVDSNASNNQLLAFGTVPNGGTSTVWGFVRPPAQMRIIPAISYSALADIYGNDTVNSAVLNALTIVANGSTHDLLWLSGTQAGSTWTNNRGAYLFLANASSKYVRFDAEL